MTLSRDVLMRNSSSREGSFTYVSDSPDESAAVVAVAGLLDAVVMWYRCSVGLVQPRAVRSVWIGFSAEGTMTAGVLFAGVLVVPVAGVGEREFGCATIGVWLAD